LGNAEADEDADNGGCRHSQKHTCEPEQGTAGEQSEDDPYRVEANAVAN